MTFWGVLKFRLLYSTDFHLYRDFVQNALLTSINYNLANCFQLNPEARVPEQDYYVPYLV
jgi:hypothetical protein